MHIHPSSSTTPLSQSAAVTTTPYRENPLEHRSDEQTYHLIYKDISEKYSAFNQQQEMGYGNKKGVTGDIDGITKADLISVLKHIKSTPFLLDQCRNSSAKSALFTKLYLMSNDDQGWNLRLHTFSVKGSGLGGEDSPHYHRWTLASQILTGGYVNVNYEEGSIDQPHEAKNEYSKYELSASKNQSSKDSRTTNFVSKSTMTPTNKELYVEGATHHFPVELAHSVETHAAVMGTTLTLAHTAKSLTNTSYAFEKNDEIIEIPQRKIESNVEFESILQEQITLLQVLRLSSDLNNFLQERRGQGAPLTPKEENHINDFIEPNYVETSLLPALAIYHLESINAVDHDDFSAETQIFLDDHMGGLDRDALNDLIENNQGDLFAKRLTIEVNDPELALKLNEHKNKKIDIGSSL